MQQPTDLSVDQRKGVPGQHLDIALVAGQYKIYCATLAFDPPTQNVTYSVIPPFRYSLLYILKPSLIYDTKENGCD